jgi:predicted acylesterase/phospholipase RssA
MSYTTLLLSSGGMRILAILGALACLEDADALRDVDTLVGTSAGSLVAYLLVLGYTPIELLALTSTHPVLTAFPDTLDLPALVDGRGGLSFAPFQDVLEDLTIARTGVLFTFAQFHARFGKTLVVAAYNCRTDAVEYFAPDTHPEMPVLMALRLACALPLVFKEMSYADATYLDAALTEVLPLGYLHARPDRRALALLLEPFAYRTTPTLYHYLHNLLAVPTRKLMEAQLADPRVRGLDCMRLRALPDIHALDYTIPTKTKLDLFMAGYVDAQTWFSPSASPPSTPAPLAAACQEET